MALADVAEVLAALLKSGGEDNATFQRMVVWYAEVADELDCRAAYDQLVQALLTTARGRATPALADALPA